MSAGRQDGGACAKEPNQRDQMNMLLDKAVEQARAHLHKAEMVADSLVGPEPVSGGIAGTAEETALGMVAPWQERLQEIMGLTDRSAYQLDRITRELGQ